MIGLLIFLLAARDSTAVVTPGDAQMERGPALGKLLVDSPGFLILDFTLGTQFLNLSPNPTHSILWDRNKISGVFNDVSRDGLHRASSQLRMTTAPECLGDAEQKLQLGGDEVQAWTDLESSFGFNLLDAFMTVSKLSQGAHLTSAEIPNIGTLNASVVGSQAQLSNRKRPLRGGRSTPEKTTVLVVLSSDFLSPPSMSDAQQPDWLRCEEAAGLQLVLCVSSEAQRPSYLVDRKVPERIQLQASPGEMGLRAIQAEVAQGIQSAFTVHIRVQKTETGFLFSSPYVPVQDTRSLESLPNVGYRLGGSNVNLASTPSLAYRETVVPRYWLPEIHAPQTIRGYSLSFPWPRLQDPIKKHGSVARTQNAHPQRVENTPQTYSTLLPLLNKFTRLCNINVVWVLPPESLLSLRKPVWDPSDPEDSQGPPEYLYLFRGAKPYTKQLFYSILKDRKGRVNRLVRDDYDSRVSRHSILSHLPGPFYVALSFVLVIVFVWILEHRWAVLGNGPDFFPLENELMREFRLEGEAIIRHLCWNVLGMY